MKTLSFYLVLFAAFLVYSPLKSQNLLWDQEYMGEITPSNNDATSLTIDLNGNVYVTGMCDSDPNECDATNIGTVKFLTTSGGINWVNRFRRCNISYDDGNRGNSIANYTDGSGNTWVYVTGRTWNTTYDNFDFVIVKINASNGGNSWSGTGERSYNGTGNGDDEAASIVVDANGNAYVTGYSYTYHDYGNNKDYLTIKYNSSGAYQWHATYDGTGHSEDYANSIAIDSSGNVYITGTSPGDGTLNDIATIKYNSSGVEQWIARYDSSGAFESGNDIAFYSAVYVTGSSGNYCTTIKYTVPGGERTWVRRDPEGKNVAIELFKRDLGEGPNNYAIDVFVTGRGKNSGNDVGQTIRYSQYGNQDWLKKSTYTAEFKGLAIDPSENIFVVGESDYNEVKNYLTLKYDADGNDAWESPAFYHYDPSGGVSDEHIVVGIGTDLYGNCYVAGQIGWTPEEVPSSIYYVTVKYGTGGDNPNSVYYQNGNNNPEIPNNYFLKQNYPNPFNPVTTVKYGIPQACFVKISVYNIFGQGIKQLVNEYKNAGYYEAKFDGSNLASGIYIYRIIAGNFTDTKKFVLMK
jgi:hypothetical protein